MTAPAVVADRVRRRFVVRGVVQGVGFRPFVYVTATALSLTGTVTNDSGGVVTEVEGSSADVCEFERRLRADPPPMAMISSITTEVRPPIGGTGFTIGTSHLVEGPRTLAAADVATCDDCLRELADPADRHFRHPFVSCTNCGPRFTIIADLPYDRPNTTMARFAMCSDCSREYADPADRRFHAQTIACPNCGPDLELIVPAHNPQHGAAALAGARDLLAGGAIVAIKGLGGYHVACAADDEHAVAELRRRKRRGDKPFAVMVRDLAAARQFVTIGDAEAALLSSSRRPIVLLGRRSGASMVAPSVAPGNPDLGVLLAYTPLHTLLFGLGGDGAGPQALVMTSGNLGGEPIAYDDADAVSRLAPLVGAWLRHDRQIIVACDDSVSRVVDGIELPIRRSRGYAPLPVLLPFDVPATLAVGGDLKNTFCLARGRYAWMSQHIGDMDDLATLDAFDAAERHLEMLTGVTPVQLVADRHPGYRSARWADRQVGGRPVHAVQHHHAHVAAVMGEHGLGPDERVIGFAFDGTGYGSDGAIWGGEVLIVDYKGFDRAAHLSYVGVPGGDASVQRPYRMALAHLAASGIEWRPDLPPVAACPSHELDVLAHQVATGFGCAPTSSLGRLFDAVASLAGIRHVVDYEAQAAIELEGLARSAFTGTDGYTFGLAPEAGSAAIVVDVSPVIRAIVTDVRTGTAAAVIGARFHAAVVDLVCDLADRVRRQSGLTTVVLAGGVFANALLLTNVRRRLQATGFTVLCPRALPPNDGGLALGQVLAAAVD